MTKLESQNQLFSLIGEELRKKIECYVIGRSAMLYYGTKDATKDIDLVFDTNKAREEILRILESLGYKERETKILYFQKKNSPILLQRGDERLDLFVNKVITFELTESIKDRITSIYEFSNLIVKVVSPEDIILLKCATERASDRLDAAEIIKKANINWDILIDEAVNQTKLGEHLFPVFLFDFLYELKEDLKADIPKEVINKIGKISENLLIEKQKKISQKN